MKLPNLVLITGITVSNSKGAHRNLIAKSIRFRKGKERKI